MISAVWGPSSASPLVSLSLERIARQPLARLGISYQIVPQYMMPQAPYTFGESWEEPSGIVPYYVIPLGVGLYLDSLLGGGLNGQPLPMGIAAATPALGTVIDVTG